MARSTDPAALIRRLSDACDEAGRPERAAGEKAYLRSELRFAGVDAPFIRHTARELARSMPGLDHDRLWAIAAGLAAADSHDLRAIGVGLLERRVDLLVPADLRRIEDLARSFSEWALGDWLAIKVAGPLLARTPRAPGVLRRWAKDEHVWVRRLALIATLDELRAGRGDLPLFEELAVPMLPDSSFWIRKAIGWVLREVSKKRPAEVERFLRAHGAAASGLTFREASRRLPKAARKRLEKARARPRPTVRRAAPRRNARA